MMEKEMFQKLKVRITNAKSVDEWEAVIIESGESLNGLYYPEEVLARAAPLFENVPCYAFEFSGQLYDHLPEHIKQTVPVGFVKNMVGFFDNVKLKTIDGKKALVGKFHVIADWLKNTLKNTPLEKIPKLFGFSIDAEGTLDDSNVVSINRVDSVDLVSYPAAGGRFLRVLASRFAEALTKKEVKMDKTTLMFRGLKDAESISESMLSILFEGIFEPDEIKESVDELLQLANECLKCVKEGNEDLISGLIEEARKKKKKKDEYMTPYGKPQAYPSPKASVTTEAQKEEVKVNESEYFKLLKELQDKLAQMEFEKYREEALAQSGLSEATKQMIKSAAKDKDTLDKMIKEMKALEAEFVKQIPPTTNVRVEEAEVDRIKQMIDDAIEGKASIREAYRRWTGDTQITGLIRNCSPDYRRRLKESLTTTDWAQVLGDSIRRRMLEEYRTPSLQDWRLIVSDVVPLVDFRDHIWVRIGGYGELPTVSESEAYPELTPSPPDEEIRMAVSKKGGLESVTLEMIKNDDLLAIKSIPKKLGRAAAQTLHRTIFNGILANNPTIYDGVNLFHANHRNYLEGAYPLNHTNFMKARKAMATQRAFGASIEALNLYPKFLVIPPDLEDMAFKLCHSAVQVGGAAYYSGGDPAEAATVPNLISAKFKPDYIVVPYWIDTNDWVAVCDPKDCPTIIVGFLDGKEEPELIIADDPTTGSLFTADKITYKIRHVWGVAVADYRGMFKAAVV